MRRSLLVIPLLLGWLLANAPRAQVSWLNANPATTPSYRKYTTMVWDSVRGRVLLFGGQGDLETYLDDTWEWDGVRWFELSPLHRPAQREDHMMAFDRQRGRAVIFGGHDVNVQFLDDTWEWDGTDWIRANTPTRPPALAYAAMAYDPVRQVAVMFGGLNQALVETGGTWEWDGTTWHARTVVASPGPRSHHAMAWDPVLQRVVLYGGQRTSPGWLNDHWAWDGTNWTQVTTGPSLMDTRMVYDTVRNRLLMWGGRMQPGNQSWEFVGGQWVMRTATGIYPVGRQAHTMAFDERNGNTVLFAGYDDVVRYGETWVHSALVSASAESFGHSCGNARPAPHLHLLPDQRPWLGDTLTFLVDAVPSNQSALLAVGGSRANWGSMTLPLDLGSAGMPGCELLVSWDALVPLPTTGSTAALRLVLDGHPSWLGLALYVQGAVCDPSANSTGIVFTNGLRLLIGGR